MWFGTSEPDDSKGALPYDTYIIEEMRCDSNKGFELIPPFEIVVSRNTIQLSYKILRKKELIVKKGNDFFVTKDNCCIITKMKEETDLQIIKCLHELAEMGYSREQTKSLILRKLETLKFPQ